jgi:hypothetical protein
MAASDGAVQVSKPAWGPRLAVSAGGSDVAGVMEGVGTGPLAAGVG